MRELRDSFLHFLADNLSSSGISVHPIRRDSNNPGTEKLQANCINVQFLNVEPSVQVGNQLVAIDVIHEEELTALDWMETVWDLLSSTFYAPLYDYSDPANPAPLGTNIMWGRNRVRFKPMNSDFYTRYRCEMSLEYHNPIAS